jgi:hypothetical protein
MSLDEEGRFRMASRCHAERVSIRSAKKSLCHLTLPGASHTIQLHLHQKSGVWRFLQTDNTLLGHIVGAGKLGFAKLASCRHGCVCINCPVSKIIYVQQTSQCRVGRRRQRRFHRPSAPESHSF